MTLEWDWGFKNMRMLRRMKLASVTAGAMAAALFSMTASGADGQNLSAQVDALFAKYDKPDSPGCAVGVLKDGAFAYKRSYGMANLEFGVPLDEHTPMRIASITKQFTATAVILAAQQGKLALTDDIRKHLPWFPDYGHKITIANLVHQTSGVRDFINLGFLEGDRLEDFHEQSEFIDRLKRQKALNFVPGSQWEYSNSNYFLLELIIKEATGQTLRAFAKANIFDPLGMHETFFGDEQGEVIKRAAAAYGFLPDGRPTLKWTNFFTMTAAGNLVTTVADLALWDANFYNNRLGKGDQLITALRDHGVLSDGRSADYGGGLMFTSYRGLPSEWHNGSFSGFNTNMQRFPGQHFTTIVLCNALGSEPGYFGKKIADIYLGSAFKSKGLEEPAAEVKVEDLQRWAGYYRETSTKNISNMAMKDGHLIWDGAQTLVTLDASRFRTENGREVRFSMVNNVPTMTVLDSHPPVLQRFEPAKITQADFAAYAGNYYGDELQSRYILQAGDGVLKLSGPGALGGMGKMWPREFKAGGPDEFYNSRLTLQFQRDAEKQITGFILYGNAERGLIFTRLAE